MPNQGVPVIFKNKIAYGYAEKSVQAYDVSVSDYNALTEQQQLDGSIRFIQGVDAIPNGSNVWAKLGTTPLAEGLPRDCSQAVNQVKSNLTDLGTETTLADVGFTTNNESSDLTLSDNYTNYEYILIQFKVAGEYKGSILLQSEYITPTSTETNNNNMVTIWHSSNYHASLRIQFKSETTFRHFITESVGWVSATAKNVKIVGINKKAS